jgi:acyl-CoA thioesterase-1
MKPKKIYLLTLAILAAFNVCQAQVADSSTYLSNLKTELNKIWPKNKTINLVFHGHSVPSGYWTNHEVHTLESYPQLVLQKLKAVYPYAVINVITTSIGGENAIKGEMRFEEDVLTHKPDVVFIDYALNDRGEGLEKAKVAWENMIQKALKANVKVVLLTPSPDTRVNMLATDSKSLQAHALQIADLAKKYHVGLADSYTSFMHILKKGGSIKDYMSGVNHPNLKGHEVISGEIIKWLVPAIR